MDISAFVNIRLLMGIELDRIFMESPESWPVPDADERSQRICQQPVEALFGRHIECTSGLVEKSKAGTIE